MRKGKKTTKQWRCSTFRKATSSSARSESAETSTIHWRGGEGGQHFKQLMSAIDSASFKNSCMPRSVMWKQMWLEDGGLKRFNSSSLSLSAKTEKIRCVMSSGRSRQYIALHSLLHAVKRTSCVPLNRKKPPPPHPAKQTTALANHRKAVVPRLLG